MMNMCTLMAFHAAPAALKTKETERVSAKDPELQAVRRCLVEERWNGAPKQYLPMRNELTFIGHVILRGARIVMPQALRKRVVSLDGVLCYIDLRDFAHEGSVSSLNSINSPKITMAWKFAIDDKVSLRFSSLFIVYCWFTFFRYKRKKT